MSRSLVAVLLVLLAPSSALAARAWDPPALVTPDAPAGVVSRANDGTVATGWTKGTDAVVQVGSSAPIDLGPAGLAPVVAAANAHDAAAAWTEPVNGADQTYVAFIHDGVAGAPALVGAGRPVALATDPAGDMTIVVQRPPYYSGGCFGCPRAPVALPADDATAYRPAGGGFGGLTALPIKGFTQLAMSSDGEALFGIGSDTSAMLVTRVGEGPMVSHAVPGPAYNPDVAVDGKGHRIAAWLGAGQTINVSTRTADGVWTDSNTGTTASTLALASNASGDGVLAWTGQPQPLHVASVSLATGAIAPAVTLGDRTAFDPTVAVDLDGSALVAFDREDGNAFELDTAHRDGTGAFGAVLPVGCAQTAPIATDADTLYAGRARLGWAVSRSHTADADTGQACVPDPGPAQPFPNVSPFPVLAGVPVRLDASGAARPGATVTSTTWSIAGAPADGAVITHTFPEAGIYGVTVSTRQVGPDSQPGGDVYVDAGTVDVLSRPAIAIRHVRRRSLHAHVTGMTVFAPVSIVIAVRAHGKRVGHATATTGPAGVDVTVPLHRAHGQLTVILRQAGKRLAVAHPRTRTSP